MKKKPSVRGFSNSKASAQSDDWQWRNGGDVEIAFYARALHKAAKTLMTSLELQPDAQTDWDACSVVVLYREAIELYMKALVHDGGDFLKERTDSTRLYKTHSLRWLAQIVCQIIKAAKWESGFKCEGIASLADFNAAVNELEALDPVAVAVHHGSRRPYFSVPQQLQPPNVVQFAKKLDRLTDLLDATVDLLAAMGDAASGDRGV
jgi:hypothetical protein